MRTRPKSMQGVILAIFSRVINFSSLSLEVLAAQIVLRRVGMLAFNFPPWHPRVPT